MLHRLVFGFAAALVLVSSVAFADFVTFATGDSFDNDVVNDQAGPFVNGTISSFLTTTALSPIGAKLNTVLAGLGIDAGVAVSGFDDGESWSFQWDTLMMFEGIDFGDFNTATEQFSLQSSSWISLAITPTDSNISFSPATGTFSFTSDDASDDFNLNDLSGGMALPVPVGTAVTVSFTDSGGGFGRIQRMGATPVPEPSIFLFCAALLGVVGGAKLFRRSILSTKT